MKHPLIINAIRDAAECKRSHRLIAINGNSILQGVVPYVPYDSEPRLLELANVLSEEIEGNEEQPNQKLEDVAEFIAEQLSGEVRAYRLSVAPSVASLSEILQDLVDRINQTELLESNYEVEVLHMPTEVIEMAEANLRLGAYENVSPPPRTSTGSYGLGVPVERLGDLEGLSDFLSLGSPDWDNVVQRWLLQAPIEAISEFLIAALSYPSDTSRLTENYLQKYDGFTAANVLTALYLATNIISEEIPERAVGFNVSEYLRVTSALQTYAGVRLHRAIAKHELLLKREVLVLSSSREKKKIRLVGDFYEKYLENATRTAIIGRIMSDDGTTTLSNMISKSHHHGVTFQKAQKTNQNARNLKLLTVFKSQAKPIAKQHFLDTFSELEESYYSNPKEGVMREVCKQMDVIINEVSVSDLSEIQQVALRIIAKGRFPFTAAYTFLSNMDSIADESSIGDDVSTLATLERLAEFFSTQITRVK